MKKDSDIWEEYGRMFWVFFEGDQNDLSQGRTDIVVPSNFLHFFHLYSLYHDEWKMSYLQMSINILTLQHPPKKLPKFEVVFFPHFFPRGSFWIRSHIFIKACVATESGGQASPDQCLLRSLDLHVRGFFLLGLQNQKIPWKDFPRWEGILANFSCVSRWCFQICFIFIPTWGRFPIWLIFFTWVETTN